MKLYIYDMNILKQFYYIIDIFRVFYIWRDWLNFGYQLYTCDVRKILSPERKIRRETQIIVITSDV